MEDDKDYLDFSDIVRLLWGARYAVIASAVTFAVIAAIIAFNRPDVFTSSVLLRPTEEKSAVAPQMGALASLGSLAGLNLGDSQSRTELAIALLESRQFLVHFAREHNIVPELLAASWDKNAQRLKYDEDVYSPESGKWTREVEPPASAEPNDTEVFEAMRGILAIQRNPDNGFVRVSIDFLSPVHAKEWVGRLVADLNDEMRRKAIKELDLSIAYLRQQLEETSVADLKASVSELLQHQIRDRMLADARAEFALETIDPAYAPDVKSGPPRMLMVLAGGLLGGLLGLIASLMYYGVRTSRRASPALED